MLSAKVLRGSLVSSVAKIRLQRQKAKIQTRDPISKIQDPRSKMISAKVLRGSLVSLVAKIRLQPQKAKIQTQEPISEIQDDFGKSFARGACFVGGKN